MRKHGSTPSWRDKCVTLAAISPPGDAWGRFVGGQQSGLAGCKWPPLFKRGASSCSSQRQRQREPWGASPRPTASTYLPTYLVEQATAQWLLDSGLNPPLRCRQCRGTRKDNHQEPQPAQPAKIIQYHHGYQESEAKAWHPQVHALSLLFPNNDLDKPADNPKQSRSNSRPEEVAIQSSDHDSFLERPLSLRNTGAVGESKEERSDPRPPISPTSAEKKAKLHFHELSDNSDELRAASEPKGLFWDSSSTDNECESLPSSASEPPTYWPSNTVATYARPDEQCQLFEAASLKSASDSLSALESSSIWTERNTVLPFLTSKQILPMPLNLQGTLKQTRLDPPFLSVINFKSMTKI